MNKYVENKDEQWEGRAGGPYCFWKRQVDTGRI